MSFRRRSLSVVVPVVFIAVVLAAVAYTTSPVSTTMFSDARFGGVSLRIEYATTTIALERGLGGRKDVPDDYGMLFVFPKADRYGIWMKDMLVPIDIFWLDDKGQVRFIMEGVATSTYPSVFYPEEPALYVLETRAGFAREHGVTVGDSLTLKNWPSVSQ